MINPTSVLFVDDNDAFVSVCTICLEASGFDVSQAHSGREAIDQSVFREFAVAIVDLNMPDLDGTATIAALLDRRPSLRIIAISCGTLSPHFARLSALGVRHFISKPLKLDDLVGDIHDLLDPMGPVGLGAQAA
jgi:DNA-binding NtrC family response regulator